MIDVKRKRNQLPRVFRDVTNVMRRTAVDVRVTWMYLRTMGVCLIVMCLECSALSRQEVS